MAKKCGHDEQETLTLRFETELYKRSTKGEMVADPQFHSDDIEVASKCLVCGEVVKKVSEDALKAAVEGAINGFFDK